MRKLRIAEVVKARINKDHARRQRAIAEIPAHLVQSMAFKQFRCAYSELSESQQRDVRRLVDIWALEHAHLIEEARTMTGEPYDFPERKTPWLTAGRGL